MWSKTVIDFLNFIQEPDFLYPQNWLTFEMIVTIFIMLINDTCVNNISLILEFWGLLSFTGGGG